ncbi:hypothetical protein [Actinacidiphila acididurans]|uniref:Lipoprotein n=1 Tax=Actinacidiphila acididurans TaxID=2784346 RepID=A0ABS2TNT9_9ACTN|nr:hypothetical protein [Actinacidiphila acididurans]MBM9504994.1 hypothetical protein [Actinacidiphila acididurans]
MSRSTITSLAAFGAVVVAVAAGAVACGPAKDSSAPPAGATTRATASAPATHKDDKGSGTSGTPTARPAFKGNGTYRVGADIAPGTYLTSGNGDGMCYWERAKDASGDMDSVLANDNVTGSSYVTITRADKIFKTTDCKDWYAVPAKAGAPKSPKAQISGDGMYKVGADMQPGTYRSTGNADGNCYWERAKDALHGTDSIIANDNVTGTAIVTIAHTDAYFKSSGCGDWRKTG